MPTGKLKRVIDGDTIEIKSGERVRIAGLNAPELGQPGGQAAKRRLQQVLPPDTSIGLSPVLAKSYDRNVRKVTKNGRDLANNLGKP